MDTRLVHPSNFIFCGPTFSGKTSTIAQLLCRAPELFVPVPESVHYCYNDEQTSFQKLKDECPLPVTFQKGFDRATYDSLSNNSILVLDDLIHVLPVSLLNDIAVRGTHHSSISLIVCLHNFFEKSVRTLSINTQYFLIFRSCRDIGQIRTLGVQLGVGPRFMTDIYRDATKDLYDFLFVDVRATTPDQLRFRSNIFKQPVNVYLPNDAVISRKHN